MDLKEQFITILKSADTHKAMAFFKTLTKQDKKALAPSIKKIARNLNRYYNAPDFSPTDELTKTLILSAKCQGILEKFAFVCLSYEEMRRAVEHISLEVVETTILPWYQPSWLNRYFLEMVEFQIDYEKMLVFMDRGWIEPTKQFIADNTAYGLLGGTRHQIGTEEYIWYLFEYYTTIGNDDRWLKQFKKYISTGEIDRLRVLQETLLTSNRNFNKPMTGWFCKLFTFLEPTNEELLTLQDELSLSLASPQSKPIGDALKYIKTIYKEKDFNIDGFIEQIPILFSWEVKSIINSTLTLIDSLIKYYSDYKHELCLLTTNALNLQDEKIQVKTLKILMKHHQLDNIEIQEAIALYQDVLFYSAKELLPTLESQLTVTLEEENFTNPINNNNSLPLYESFDDILFFYTSIFMDESVYSFDLFLDVLPRLDKMISEQNIDKLEPLIQQVFDICYPISFTQKHKGGIAKIMAVAIAEYSLSLSQKFSPKVTYIENIYTKAKAQNTTNEFLAKETRSLSELYSYFLNGSHLIAYKLTSHVLKNIQSNSSLPLISKPTHLSSFIQSQHFLNTIVLYQKNQLPINIIDWQIAIERVVIDVIDAHFIQNNIQGEYQKVLLYLYGISPFDIEEVVYPLLWTGAILRQNVQKDIKLLVDTFDVKSVSSVLYHSPTWMMHTKKYKKESWNEWSDKNTFWATALILNPSTQHQVIDSIYNDAPIGYQDKTDMGKFLNFIPSNPHVLLQNIINEILIYSTYSDTRAVDYSKKNYSGSETMNNETIDATLNALHGFYFKENEISYLFLASTFLYYEKTTRTLSAELWIKATQEGTMNHQLLGKTLGKLEHHEYAPLKRFTDLIIASMLNISSLHNQSLVILLSAMIIEMHDTPIKGTKKILEIYLEVLSLTKQQPFDEVLLKLGVWGEVKSLKGLVKKINAIEAF
jgi:hypothetical protein